MMIYILFNPLAGSGKGREQALVLKENLLPQESRMLDATQLELSGFFRQLSPEDKVFVSGGDGTLNHLINRLHGTFPKQQLFYVPAGSGNDFMNDVQERDENGAIPLNGYLADLPVVIVNGQKRFFINGIGFGIDGYCCQEGDRLRSAGKAKINYAAIAVKGLFGCFHTRSATVTVDGVERFYRHVWLAPTMNGRYYGGGMMVAPEQNRLNNEKAVSTVVLHCRSKLKTLIVFSNHLSGETRSAHGHGIGGYRP